MRRWSATKKIECYVDILLHNYTKHDLLSKCGTADCVNVAREEDYKHGSWLLRMIRSSGPALSLGKYFTKSASPPTMRSSQLTRTTIQGKRNSSRASADGSRGVASLRAKMQSLQEL
jgi:hypothetical protein